MEDDDVLIPKEIEDEDELDDIDDILVPGKKKPKKLDDDLSEETDSLDELADAELGEDDEPFNDVDMW